MSLSIKYWCRTCKTWIVAEGLDSINPYYYSHTVNLGKNGMMENIQTHLVFAVYSNV